MEKNYVYKGKIPKPRNVQKYDEFWLYDELVYSVVNSRCLCYGLIGEDWHPSFNFSRLDFMKDQYKFEFIGEVKP
jgi:hypothetical protein